MQILSYVGVLTLIFYYVIERYSKIKNIQNCSHDHSKNKKKNPSLESNEEEPILSFLINDTFHNMTDGFIIGNLFRISNLIIFNKIK